MESCSRVVRTYMASSREEELVELVNGVEHGTFTLLQIVQALGEYLTSDEGRIRTKGLSLLSEVISRLPFQRINAQSTRVLTTFYCGKLDDIDTIEPALKTLSTLVALPTFPESSSTEVAKSIITHVRMKSLVQNVRYAVFKTMDALIDKHREALKSLGSSFVSGYISLAEGEKDPRNLVLSFAIIRVLLIEFEVATHIDNLFDITFCYFPITFKPPPGDPYGITTDDLKASLKSCLNATPSFGPIAMPLFLDKLSASTGATKRDVLQTVESCLPVYGRGLCKIYASQLWESFRVEIFQPADQETEGIALNAARTLIRTLYPSDPATIKFDGLIVDIVEECKKILREPEKNQAQHAVKVLGSCVSSTLEIRQYVLSEGVAHLVNLYQNPDEVSYRGPILAGIAGLLMAVNEARSNGLIEESEQPLSSFKDQLVGAFSAGVKSVPARRAALEGLYQLVRIKGLLTVEEFGFLAHSVNDLLDPKVEDSDNSRSNALKVLVAISEITPKPAEEITLPYLFRSLPDVAPPRQSLGEVSEYRRVLSSLSTLCVQSTLFETLVIRLSSKLDTICSPDRISPDVECDSAYAHAILNVLKDVLAAKVQNEHADIPKYLDRLVFPLYQLFLRPALLNADGVTSDARVVKMAAEVIALVVRTLPINRQTSFAQALYTSFLVGDISTLVAGRKFPSEALVFAPFAVALPVPHLSKALLSLLQWSIDEGGNEKQVNGIWRAISSMLNKRLEDAQPFIQSDVPLFWSNTVVSSIVPAHSRRQAVRAYTWITKGLLVRNHPNVKEYVDRLFLAFSDAEIGWDAAKAIGDLGSGGEDVLNKQNYAVLRLLHVQKFLSAVLPRILAGCKSSPTPAEQTTYLVALTSLINSVPRSMYTHELPEMMPYVLRGLDLPDEDMRSNVIDTLLSVASDESPSQSGIISEHAPTIVAALLRNIEKSTVKSVRLRIAALRCLGVFPKAVKYSILHPQKNVVINKLAKAIDDPKRSVRKEAVDTRSNWYAYQG